MKFRLYIFIFTSFLTVFYLQMVSCKKNPEKPIVYSNYTGYLAQVIPDDSDVFKNDIKGDFFALDVAKSKSYYIVTQSDIDKLEPYNIVGQKITIRAIYSNNYKGYGRPKGLSNDFLYDVTVIE